MNEFHQSRVAGVLAVGFDNDDGMVRITRGEDYQVLMGSSESHQALQTICDGIHQAVKASGRALNEYTPDEFMELIQRIH